MKQEFSPYFLNIKIQENLPASRISGEISLDTNNNSLGRIIDSMLGTFKPPLSIGLMNAVHFTLSFPFQTKEYDKVFIFLINSFLFEMMATSYNLWYGERFDHLNFSKYCKSSPILFNEDHATSE